MEYKIITDRGEIERLAEDTFLSDDKMITLIDYADLRTLIIFQECFVKIIIFHHKNIVMESLRLIKIFKKIKG